MDHASCESAYCCELLRASHRTIGFDAGANILPNGNYVRHFPASIDPHWNFADQPMINSAVWRSSLVFDALNFTGRKYTGKLAFQQITFLTGQDSEDVFSHHRTTRNAKLTQLAIAVPRHNLIIAINCIK